MKNKISLSFLNELFLLCFYKVEVIDIVNQYMEYHYIPDELKEYKKILKSIKTTYINTNKIPTFGIVSQQHQQDLKLQDVLSKIKETKIPDTEIIISGLENYIKLAKFEILNKKIVEKYNKGEHEEAIKLQANESSDIVNFTIKKNNMYLEGVFSGFNKRVHRKKELVLQGGFDKEKVPFSIWQLDQDTNGGIDRTDTVLWILRSGVGKSTAMKWTAMNAARLGKKVLHLQLEGSKEEALNKYDQIWTACLYNDVKTGNINDDLLKLLEKRASYFINNGRDVYVHAFEQFNTASMTDVKNIITDFTKIQGEIDLVVIDYLKYLDPATGIKYGADTQSVKKKKEDCADKIKNSAVFFGTRIITADQATDVPPSIWNDPTQVMDRHNISGAKNLPDSFSYVLTGNQTRAEKKTNVMRIFYDKLRNYHPENDVVKIITNYNRGRFYNHPETMKTYYNE